MSYSELFVANDDDVTNIILHHAHTTHSLGPRRHFGGAEAE